MASTHTHGNMIDVCEALLVAYRKAAHSEDVRIASSHSSTYRVTRNALLAMLTVITADESASARVYDLTIDSGENVAYCLAYYMGEDVECPACHGDGLRTDRLKVSACTGACEDNGTMIDTYTGTCQAHACYVCNGRGSVQRNTLQ